MIPGSQFVSAPAHTCLIHFKPGRSNIGYLRGSLLLTLFKLFFFLQYSNNYPTSTKTMIFKTTPTPPNTPRKSKQDAPIDEFNIQKAIARIQTYEKVSEIDSKKTLRIFDLPRSSSTFYDNGKVVPHSPVEEVKLFHLYSSFL
jgi:hypothetical protein